MTKKTKNTSFSMPFGRLVAWVGGAAKVLRIQMAVCAGFPPKIEIFFEKKFTGGYTL